jgi:hypothetical protein
MVANPTIDFLCPLLKAGNGGRIPMTKRNEVKTSSWARKEDNCLWNVDAQQAIQSILQTISTEDADMLLYSDRINAVAELSLILHDLDSGKLTGNSTNHLVMGPKSVGKTSFLQGLVFAMQKLGKSTLSAYIDVSKHLDRDGPYDLIFDIFEKMFRTDVWQSLYELKHTELTDLGTLMNFLVKVKWRIFLVLDEYSVVYTLPPEKGGKWIMQLSAIGNWSTSNNPVSVILSGSAPYLRSLCFGKMAQDDISRRDFPSYTGRANNLNSDRFHVIDIKPLSLKSDLTAAYHQLFRKNPSPRQLSDFYLYTGGFLRNFSAYRRIVRKKDKNLMLKYSNRFCFNITKHRIKYQSILNSMMGTLFPEEEGVQMADLYSDPWRLMAPIDVNEVVGPSGNDPRVFYEGSDNGAFLYQQTNERDTLQFSHPLACLVLKEPPLRPDWPSWFTSHLRVCLRYPYSILGITAETVVRQSMGSDWGLGAISLPSSGSGGDCDVKMKLIFESKNRLKICNIIFPGDNSSIPYVIPYGTPLQEIPDCKGADVVVFQKGEDSDTVESISNEEKDGSCIGPESIVMKQSHELCCVHRLQIKLGQSSFGLCGAQKVLKKLKLGEAVLEYLRLTFPNITFTCVLHLVTTRPLTPQAISFLSENRVTVRDRRWLYNKWPSCVVEWARRSEIKCYYESSGADTFEAEESNDSDDESVDDGEPDNNDESEDGGDDESEDGGDDESED